MAAVVVADEGARDSPRVAPFDFHCNVTDLESEAVD
jgi:hypothetical protein